MLLSSQYVMADQIHQIAHGLHSSYQHRKEGESKHLPSSNSGNNKAFTAGHTAGGQSTITSNAFNFSSMYSGSVDGRTGAYSFNASLGKVYGNGGFGPNYNYGLHYSSSSQKNSGYGFGWSGTLSHYDKETKMLQLSTGGNYMLTWSSNIPSIKYHKLDTVHLRGDPSGKYLLIVTHKDGSEEFFNSDGNVVRLENARGDSLYFHYTGVQTAVLLGSITDDSGKTLLNVDYANTGIQVHSLQADGSMNTVKVVISNADLQNILFADGKTQVAFKYAEISGVSGLISNINYSTGASEVLQYTTIPVPTGGPVLQLHVVKSHFVTPGFNQPMLRTDYTYGLGNGHNFSGYAAGIVYQHDVDNLYMRPDNYTYQTQVTNNDGSSAITTYNKYHLILKQKLYSPGSHKLISEVDYQYPNWLNSTISSLPANYSLATKITTKAYGATSVDTQGLGGQTLAPVEHSSSYEYDNQGNVLKTTKEDGTIITNQYAPADANGFVNNIITQTTTPATLPGTPAVLPTQTKISWQTLPSKDKAMPVGVTLPASSSTLYQKTPDVWTAGLTESFTFHHLQTQPDYGMPSAMVLTNVASTADSLSKSITYSDNQQLTLWGKQFPVNIKSAQITAVTGGITTPVVKTYTSMVTGQTLMSVDALGNKTAYAYDALGRVIKVVADYGTSHQLVVSYAYQSDAGGNSVTVTAPNGYQVRKTYDGAGRALTTQAEQVNSQGKAVPGSWDTVSSQTYNADGKIAQTTAYDTNEVGKLQRFITTYHYDALGRFIGKSNFRGQAGVVGVDALTRRSYSYALLPVDATVSGASLCTVNGVAHACQARHLSVSQTDARGDKVATYLFSLDPAISNDKGQPLYTGDLKSELQAHLSSDIAAGKPFDTVWLQGWLRQAITAKAWYNVGYATYNAAHQVLVATDTDGHVTHFAYDAKGRAISKTLPNGAVQTYHYDSNNNLISVGNATSGKDVTLGQREYNAFNELIKSTDVLGHSWHYTYNKVGELTDYITPNSAHMHYTYNDWGEVVTQSVVDHPEDKVTLSYDMVTNALISRQDKTGTTDYQYADNGRLLQLSTHTTGAIAGDTLPAFTEDYQYTQAGRPVSVTRQGQQQALYHYDDLGQLSRVDRQGKSLENFTYDLAGRLIQLVKGPVKTAYTYNTLGQLSAYQTGVMQNNHLNQVADYQFHYLQDGDLTSRVRSSGGTSTTEQYQYDSINNLLNYTCNGSLCPKDNIGNTIKDQHYTFDEWNNIKTVATDVLSAKGPQTNTTTYHFDSTDPIQLRNYTNSNSAYGQSATLRYDNDGNITTNEHNQFITYTPFDQMASVKTKQGTVRYLYNGAHVQVKESAPGQAPLYFEYGAAGLSALEQGGKTTTVLYGAGRIGEITPDGTTHYTITDQSGSVLSEAMVDSAGKVSLGDSRLYTPYGIEGRAGSASKTESGKVTPLLEQNLWGFDGELKDPASGYQFLGQGYHRAYNPVMRRFMSMDSASPFGKGGFNGYIFAKNNPVMYGDPSGHMPSWLGWALDIVGEVAGVAMIVGGVITENPGLVALGIGTVTSSSLDIASRIEAKQGHNKAALGLGISAAVVGIATAIGGDVESVGSAAESIYSSASTLSKVAAVTTAVLAITATGTATAATIMGYATKGNGQTIDTLSYVAIGTGVGAAIGGFGDSFKTGESAEIGDTEPATSACFTGKTLVATATANTHGITNKPIKDIQLDEYILTGSVDTKSKHTKQKTSYDSAAITPKTWEEIDFTYYDNYPFKASYADKVISGCKKAFNTEGKAVLRCTEHMNLLRPKSIVKLWQQIQQKQGWVPVTIKEFGINNVYGHVTAIKPDTINTTHLEIKQIHKSPAIATFERHVLEVRTYTFKDLKTGKFNKITATPNHKFYVANKKKFEQIQNVSPKDRLVSATGDQVHVVCESGKENHCGVSYGVKGVPVAVYNLEVYRRHRYFVGKENILVHNICPRRLQAITDALPEGAQQELDDFTHEISTNGSKDKIISISVSSELHRREKESTFEIEFYENKWEFLASFKNPGASFHANDVTRMQYLKALEYIKDNNLDINITQNPDVLIRRLVLNEETETKTNGLKSGTDELMHAFFDTPNGKHTHHVMKDFQLDPVSIRIKSYGKTPDFFIDVKPSM